MDINANIIIKSISLQMFRPFDNAEAYALAVARAETYPVELESGKSYCFDIMTFDDLRVGQATVEIG